MTTNLKFLGAVVLGALVALTGFAFYYTASANPPAFKRAQSAAATSTLAYMTAGTATTTSPVFDGGEGNSFGHDSAAFAVQFTGSSTLSQLQIAFEYAHDTPGYNCASTPTACDWYGNTLYNQATTSPAQNITTAQTNLFNFASTSVQGGVVGITNRNLRIIDVKTPTRYVRAVMTLPPGSLNGAVWGEFIGKKQVQ